MRYLLHLELYLPLIPTDLSTLETNTVSSVVNRDTRDKAVCQQKGDSKWNAFREDIDVLIGFMRRDGERWWQVCDGRTEKQVQRYSKIFIEQDVKGPGCVMSKQKDIALAAEWITQDCTDLGPPPVVRGNIHANGNGLLKVFIGRN